MSEQQVNKPWFKQLWPWLLISGPAIAAIGCMITIYLAVNLYADKPVRDGVVKRGLKVEQLKVEQLKEEQGRK
ncbi:FixH family protein [Polynucleobacter sp. AM-25C3]|uniref:FixH family protein n=1 Tax=Polynucleobacter sp. AM-25C3 TaxID=1855569 RepID=UPI001C0D3DEE|nr:FixH family protein [Polynucleobacter sp. AM-25C3]MBU3602725.1 FixH family protein [Polynucleobacter sp. AM-25C3]